ncbi:hypothetical protein WI604_21645 [Bradyrhizobium symbiodeficiens]|uniref:hypothetical protein n=1 Tax=Bradyrhizobium symbiodeficiens TaxID=1404367 RepID=UPI0030D51C41
MALPQIVEHRGQAVVRIAPDAKRRDHRRAEQGRVRDCGEIDEADAVAISRRVGLRHRNGNGRLADPSRAGEGQVPEVDQQTSDIGDLDLAPEDAAPRRRRRGGDRFRLRRVILDLTDARLHVGDEPVAPGAPPSRCRQAQSGYHQANAANSTC